MFFVTGNENKFKEAKEIIPELEQIKLDTIEIQSLESLLDFICIGAWNNWISSNGDHGFNLAFARCQDFFSQAYRG